MPRTDHDHRRTTTAAAAHLEHVHLEHDQHVHLEHDDQHDHPGPACPVHLEHDHPAHPAPAYLEATGSGGAARHRLTMARPAYRDRDYRRAAAHLRHHPVPCRCGQPATTLDHQPPLALHDHRRGSGCCRLVPACVRCNLGAGAAIAAARRARETPRRAGTRRW